MESGAFQTPDGVAVPAVTADEMRDVDRVAVDTVGLTLPRMMEHAGRALARQALDARPPDSDAPVVVLAGAGGNGGGGLVCARHLANRGLPTTVVLDREPGDITGVPGEQLGILDHTDASVTGEGEPPAPALVVDALLGYGLRGAPRGRAATLVEWTASVGAPVLSLDVPSGVDATTGETPGASVRPDLTLTLALPKTGLAGRPEQLVLADLSVPAAVYEHLEIPAVAPFRDGFQVPLTASTS
jgi:NAD(P)H-hydrate epimerase